MLPIHILRRTKALISACGIFAGRPRTLWVSACLAMAFALALPVSSTADTVSGRVIGPDNKPVANRVLNAKPAKGEVVPFKTDGSGKFSVYLDPGRYTVSPEDDPTLQGVVDSLPQPVEQDIHLKKGVK